jgi:hypothetical protein
MPSAANASEDAGIATRARNRCSCRARQRAFRGFVLLSSLLLPAFVLAQSDARDRPGDFVINRPASLYSEPSGDAHIIRQIQPHTVVRVVEVLPQFYKVQSTKGHESGFVRRSYADPVGYHADQGASVAGASRGGAHGGQRFRVGTFRLTDPVVVRDAPSMSGAKIATLRAGAEVRVVDKDPTKHWYKIESETGNRPPGWIPVVAAQRVNTAR